MNKPPDTYAYDFSLSWKNGQFSHFLFHIIDATEGSGHSQAAVEWACLELLEEGLLQPVDTGSDKLYVETTPELWEGWLRQETIASGGEKPRYFYTPEDVSDLRPRRGDSVEGVQKAEDEAVRLARETLKQCRSLLPLFEILLEHGRTLSYSKIRQEIEGIEGKSWDDHAINVYVNRITTRFNRQNVPFDVVHSTPTGQKDGQAGVKRITNFHKPSQVSDAL